jgi:uncharacterized membrane protein (UPF0127 family)
MMPEGMMMSAISVNRRRLSAVFIALCALIPFLTASGNENLRTVPIQLPSGTIISAEVADTFEGVRTGLMFRESMPSGEGMLLVFHDLDFHVIWMKNCRISLDIIWLSPEYRIVHLEEHVPPCLSDPCPSYRTMQKARYVLEVNAGVIREEGLALGDSLILLEPLADPAP